MTEVFCAIDTPDIDSAEALVKKISATGIHLKLGLEFFIAQGPAGVARMRALAPERRIFLDLKLHDIPNTVAGAVRSALSCGADFLTVHAAGGKDMLTAASDAAKDQIKILGVTVLTHLEARDLFATGIPGTVEGQVAKLAGLAAAAGLSGVICAPHEIALLRKSYPRQFVLMVPGIRPTDSAADDQRRVMTPKQAAQLGADYLVIGRPITRASDPAAAAMQIMAEINQRAA